MSESETKLLCLWEFPESEFAAWQEFVGEGSIKSHQQYVEEMARHRAKAIELGYEVRSLGWTVEEMKAALGGRKNTSENRARALAESQEAGYSVGLKVSPNSIGSASVSPAITSDERAANTIEEQRKAVDSILENPRGGYTLGIKIGPDHIGWAAVRGK